MIDKGNNSGILAKKEGHGRIEFNIVVPTPNRPLCVCRFLWDSKVSSVRLDGGTKIGIKKAHEFLGHKSKDNTRVAAKAL